MMNKTEYCEIEYQQAVLEMLTHTQLNVSLVSIIPFLQLNIFMIKFSRIVTIHIRFSL